MRATNEVAGGRLGGDQASLRNTFTAAYRTALGGGATFGFGLRAGLLAPLGGGFRPAAAAVPGVPALPLLRPRPTHMGDRFFLGGTLDVRGFHFQTIGPRAGRYATGADAFWAAAAHVWSPLPGRLHRHVGDTIQIHGFVNAGSAVALTGGTVRHLRDAGHRLGHDVAAACGVGLSATLSFCTVEVNYNVPLRVGAGALPRPGLTACVGFELL